MPTQFTVSIEEPFPDIPPTPINPPDHIQPPADPTDGSKFLRLDVSQLDIIEME